MNRYAVLVSNGLRFEFETEIVAYSAMQARKVFATRHAGTWKAVEFKVCKIKESGAFADD